MKHNDINTLVTKWQTQIAVIIPLGIAPEKAKAILNNIIDEIVENKVQILNGELNMANTVLLFTNVISYGKTYGADTFKLAFLPL